MPRYQQALESKHATARWMERYPQRAHDLLNGIVDVVVRDVSPNLARLRTEQLIDTITDMTITTLDASDTYFWSDTILETLEPAARSIPRDFSFRREMFPSYHGFMWLEKPLEVVVDWQNPLDRQFVRAISWLPGDDCMVVIFWLEARDYQQGVNRHIVAPVLIQTIFFGSMDDTLGKVLSSTNLMRNPDVEPCMRLFSTMLSFMEQEIVEPVAAYADRATQRRLAKAGGDARPINVVTLRRRRMPGKPYDEDEDRKHVEWACQWIVRGHWKNQFYRSTGRHRKLWLHAYIKGPEDKPLIHAERVVAIVR